jgi:hypothetical protein
VAPWQEWQGSAFARVRSRSLNRDRTALQRRIERTGAHGRERSRTLAMQKVVGSSPIIRLRNACKLRVFAWQTSEERV